MLGVLNWLRFGLVNRHYSGRKARKYESSRSKSERWKFESNSLEQMFKNVITSVDPYEVIDIPVGTNRFSTLFNSMPLIQKVHGVDLSEDMLEIARKKECHSYVFHKWDIVRSPLDFRAYVSVCFRLLNLFAIGDVRRILQNIAKSTDRFIVLSIRLVETDPGEGKILENKIHLHQRNEFLEAVRNVDKPIHQMCIEDHKPGTYYVFCLEREDNFA